MALGAGKGEKERNMTNYFVRTLYVMLKREHEITGTKRKKKKKKVRQHTHTC